MHRTFERGTGGRWAPLPIRALTPDLARPSTSAAARAGGGSASRDRERLEVEPPSVPRI